MRVFLGTSPSLSVTLPTRLSQHRPLQCGRRRATGGFRCRPTHRQSVQRSRGDVRGCEARGQGEVAVSDDSRIYVDAGVPATLNDGAGAQTVCCTLQEAVLAWL